MDRAGPPSRRLPFVHQMCARMASPRGAPLVDHPCIGRGPKRCPPRRHHPLPTQPNPAEPATRTEPRTRPPQSDDDPFDPPEDPESDFEPESDFDFDFDSEPPESDPEPESEPDESPDFEASSPPLAEPFRA